MTSSKCSSCNADLVDPKVKCPGCGWHSIELARRCLACDGAIQLGPDPTTLKVPIAVALPVVGVAGFLGGFLGSLALLLGASAVGSVLMRRTLRYRCASCNALVAPSLVLDVEREAAKSVEMGHTVRAMLFGVGALISGGLWVAAIVPSDAPEPVVASSARSPVDVTVLVAASDVTGLERLVVADTSLRYSAAKGLTELGEPGIGALIRLLGHQGPNGDLVVRAACAGLKHAGPAGAAAVPRLIEVLEQSPDRFVRSDAMEALGAMGEAATPAIEVLEKLAQAPESFGAKAALKRIRAAR